MKKLYVICSFFIIGCGKGYQSDTVTVVHNNCTVIKLQNGLMISCPDGTSETVTNGTPGLTGPAGPQGEPGTPGKSDGSSNCNDSDGSKGKHDSDK